MAKQRHDIQPTDRGLSGTGGCCLFCGPPFKAGDSSDAACGLCSEESIERVLAPFLVLRHKQNTESEKEVHHTKAVLYRPGHNPEQDPGWIALRDAAKTRWPDLNSVDDDVVIATRISKWLEEQRPSASALQRPLVPITTVCKLLNAERQGTSKSRAVGIASNRPKRGKDQSKRLVVVNVMQSHHCKRNGEIDSRPLSTRKIAEGSDGIVDHRTAGRHRDAIFGRYDGYTRACRERTVCDKLKTVGELVERAKTNKNDDLDTLPDSEWD